MNTKIAAAILSAVLCVAPHAHAADKLASAPDLQAMYKAVQADKKAYVASVLDLTPAEAKRFWPIYDQYQRDLDVVNRRRNVTLEGLIGQDKPISDLYAKQLAAELIATDEVEIKARRTMQNKLMRPKPMTVLPAKKAARYLQLESQIRAVQFYGIAEQFPLIH
jgi:Spy/CpxP family protein refolding chaperone